MNKELRYVPAELRAVKNDDGSRTVTGYCAVFNKPSVDFGGWSETIAPGAFAKCLAQNPDVLFLRDHDPAILLGRTTSGTLKLSEDSVGLRFECTFPSTSQANDLAVLIDRGDISGCSFGFVANVDNWSNKDGQTVRTLIDVDIFDASIVATPAYPDTSLSLRNAPAEIRSTIEQRAVKTKSVDGEELPASSFLIVGDPQKTDTWHLPWKFDDDEKTKSHLKNALSRFDQVEGVSEDDKNKAWTKLVKLCKKYGIEVSEDDKRSKRSATTVPMACDCECDPCGDGSCDDCLNADCNFEFCSCPSATEQARNRAHMLLTLAKLKGSSK